MKDLRNYSLAAHNTFGIDVCCRRFMEYESVKEAQQLVTSLTKEDFPLLVLGSGSNLLLTADYPHTVVHSTIKGIEVQKVESDDVFLKCGSGEIFDDVVKFAVDHGYHGAENLSLIPGEVGASAVQNIGAYGVEAKDIIYKVETVEIATGRLVVFSNVDCEYSYRQSKFKHDWRDKFLVTHVVYRLSKSFHPDLDYGNIRSVLADKGVLHPTSKQLRDVIIEIRNAKLPDPKLQGNAGSFFMNPIVDRAKYEELATLYPNMPHYAVDATHEKIPAGWMIEQCGWKGKTLGPVGVHDRQALVLVNRGGAKGMDVVRLYKAIQADVNAKFGIEICPEVNVK